MAIIIGETTRIRNCVSKKESKDTSKNKYRCKVCGAILVKCDADLQHVFIHEGKLYAKAIPNYIVDVVNEGEVTFAGYTCSNCGATIEL